MMTQSFFRRSPLSSGRFVFLPLGALSLFGNDKDRLTGIRTELFDRAGTFFPGISEESEWFGGIRRADAAAGSFLEATLRIAALLVDDELRTRSMKLVDKLTRLQREDGSFAPDGMDFRAAGRMLRAVYCAYSISGTKSYMLFMLRYMKKVREMLEAGSLTDEDAMHTADTLEVAAELYSITGQRALLPILKALTEASFDYTTVLSTMPYRVALSRTISKEDLESEQEDGYYHQLLRRMTGENLCEGLRTTVLNSLVTGNGKQLSAGEAGLASLMRFHGTPGGAVNSDPLPAGTNPARGIYTTSAAELTDSLVFLLSSPNGEIFADRLSDVFYNALSAAISPDLRGVQSIQSANETVINDSVRYPFSALCGDQFTCNDAEAFCSVLRAVSSFYSSQWMLSRDGGLFAAGYASCSAKYRLPGGAVRVETSGDYPYLGAVRITVRVKDSMVFPLHLSVPAWAEGAQAAVSREIYRGEAGKILTIAREWHDGDVVLLNLPMAVRMETGYHGAVSVKRGPLCFCLTPESENSPDSHGYLKAEAKHDSDAALVKSSILNVTDDGRTITGRFVCESDNTGREEFERELKPYASSPVRIAVFPVKA